jgi:hypothetical protein
MNSKATPVSTYHALLVGIDSYTTKPLGGCVNDIDAVQQLLLDSRVGVREENIIRLASPHPNAKHQTAITDQPATLANIRAALAKLGSEEVGEHDRVFIYYSGHGARVSITTSTPDRRIFHRESLVPVDFNAQSNHYRLLLDFEFNQLLAAIVARTPAVTVCLDCCHSAGATRAPELDDMIARFLDLDRHLPPAEAPSAAALVEEVRGMASSVDDCQVVAACLNHELAQEATGADGIRHGLLTRALVTELNGIPGDDFRSVAWGRIWQKMRVNVESSNPAQHLWMAGNLARDVIAGPPVADDPGVVITRSDPNKNRYQIDAGTLASITEGATLAVYRDKPARFPPLNSEEDRNARLSTVLLKVIHADRSVSVAEADGAPFDLPPGARGRLVSPGAPVKLRCAVVPSNDEVAASLSHSPLLALVEESNSEVRLKQGENATWALTDDIHGAKPGHPVLFTLRPDMLGRVREVFEHYFYYALPLRMATLCTDISGALQISLLACPKERKLTPAEAQAADLPEAGTPGEFPYELAMGDDVCIRVRNTSGQRLRVALLNSAATGRVQYLGDQIIDPRSFYVFWARNDLGSPFTMKPPEDAMQGIDRIVAIGTTAFDKDISYLRLDTTFAEIADATRGGSENRDFDDNTTNNPPADQWTATQMVVRTTRGPLGSDTKS